jgi:putative redox protein
MNERIADVELVEGLRAEALIGKHVVILDEPEKDGGTDMGPTPVQNLLAALGGCSVITMRLYSQRKGWDLQGARVRVRLVRPEKGENGAPKFTQEIELQGDLDDEQRERLRVIAGRCPVHRLLDGPVESEEILA